ncbi:MAG: GerAB/ArcD/ProY family transporter, partial [Lachnospiraceae bacterium]|nr:GerAB/ArcD/ProY family transporter [Lachnospiraceae bacterium]
PDLVRQNTSVKCTGASIFAVLVLLCILTLLLDGIFGIHGAGQEAMLTIAIMRYIRLPFGVLERFDMLMIWFFMTGCFVLICSTLYQIGELLSVFFKKVKRIWLLLGVSAVVWLAAASLPAYPDTLLLFLYYGAWIDVPLSLLLPLAELLGCKLHRGHLIKRVGSMLLLFGMVVLLSGCRGDLSARNDMRNVEERDYGTILFISKGENGKKYHFDLGIAQEKRLGQKSQIEKVSRWDCDDFKELAREYQKIKGKDLSLSHLKVILLASDGETVLKRDLQELLCILDENEEIAKTCPVLQVTEREAFLRYLEEAGSPVGSYLEAVIRTGERQKKNIPWLKDYLKAMREEQGVEAYLLESVPEGWTVKRYTFLFKAAE